jgi:hypothetical protein
VSLVFCTFAFGLLVFALLTFVFERSRVATAATGAGGTGGEEGGRECPWDGVAAGVRGTIEKGRDPEEILRGQEEAGEDDAEEDAEEGAEMEGDWGKYRSNGCGSLFAL